MYCIEQRAKARIALALGAALIGLAGLAGCPGPAPATRAARAEDQLRMAKDRERAQPAVAALRAGDFDAAGRLAGELMQEGQGNSLAAAVRAIVGYQAGMHQLRREFLAVLESAGQDTGFDHKRMRAALEATSQALARAHDDLGVAALDPEFALELCLACWRRDWNHSGEVDDNDLLLLQIEIDAQGDPIPEGDPRRTPTFRFDAGDVLWAQAMVSFQRAALELILAYKWSELDKLLQSAFSGQAPRIVIELGDRARVHRARDLIRSGLTYADGARQAYLAETDDDREWVPNPRQKDHPLPLPVDDALFQVWQGVIADARDLIDGKTGLGVTELAQLGDDQWRNPPRGYIDIGAMLERPRHIVFDFQAMEREVEAAGGDETRAVEAALASILGEYYREEMPSTPLVGRLQRMKRELDRGQDTFERKLRYLLWLN